VSSDFEREDLDYNRGFIEIEYIVLVSTIEDNITLKQVYSRTQNRYTHGLLECKKSIPQEDQDYIYVLRRIFW